MASCMASAKASLWGSRTGAFRGSDRPLQVRCSHLAPDSVFRRRRTPSVFAAKTETGSGNEGTSEVSEALDCVGTGLDTECFPRDEEVLPSQTQGLDVAVRNGSAAGEGDNALARGANGASIASSVEGSGSVLTASGDSSDILLSVGSTLLLISPFFFWGSSMVAMKDVLPRAGPMFVAAFRLIPAGAILVAYAASRGRPMPTTGAAWLAILAFAAVDAACFQGCLSEGLKRTSAGLGSVIIDSQPLTVAVLAAALFGERLGPRGVAGLFLGVAGLCLLEVPLGALSDQVVQAPPEALLAAGGAEEADWNLFDSGEWWMLLAAQSMAVGTVMVRWVCKYCDPIMATGWHLMLGGVPLLALSALQHDPGLQPGGLASFSSLDWALLGYTSVFGSAVSYGVFFFNATRGNLTRLSSLTFLTPAFAALFGFLFLDETFNSQQIVGALVTVVAIYLVNTQPSPSKS